MKTRLFNINSYQHKDTFIVAEREGQQKKRKKEKRNKIIKTKTELTFRYVFAKRWYIADVCVNSPRWEFPPQGRQPVVDSNILRQQSQYWLV